MGGQGDGGDDEGEDGQKHCGDQDGGPVFGFGCGLGDAEEINEAGGDVSQDSHFRCLSLVFVELDGCWDGLDGNFGWLNGLAWLAVKDDGSGSE